MILSAHQPAYLPWLGYFQKIITSDVFCILDTVQFTESDYINRNRINGKCGPIWLSVPVYHTGHSKDRICDIRIVQNGWQRSHLRSLQQSYSKARYFADYFGGLESVLSKEHAFLSDVNHELLFFLMDALGCKARIVRASDYSASGRKSEYLLQLCAEFGARAFLFGSLGRNYADARLFEQAGIEMKFLDYRHPVYCQQRGPFVPNLSVIDLLFNEGPRSLDILTSTNR